MNYLFLLLLLTSCGKKLTSGEAPYPLTDISRQDRDGDGIPDVTELAQARNPLVAEVRETFPALPPEFVLVQNDGTPIKMAPTVRRRLRSALVAASLTATKTTNLPEISQLELSFIHQPGYWRTRMAGKHFTRVEAAGLPTTKLEPGFIDTPIITLNAQLEHGDLLELKEKAYRLIVSTPEREQIFFVSVDLPLRDFLHQAGLTPRGAPLAPHADAEGWRLVNTDERFAARPVAGETYAVVYGSAADFRRAAVRGQRLNLLAATPVRFAHAQRFNVTIVLGHMQKAVTHSKTQIHTLSSHPDHAHLTCKFTETTLVRREAQVHRSVDAVLAQLELDGAYDLGLGWVEVGAHAVAANVTLSVNSDDWTPQFRSGLRTEKVFTGVVTSGCRAIPAQPQPQPLYTEISGELLIGDQI